MDRLIIALWMLSLALVGLGILALFEGWLLPDGCTGLLSRLRAAGRGE